MQAAPILTGLTTPGLTAPLLRRHAARVRLGIAAVYLAGVAGFVVYSLLVRSV